MIPLRAWTGSCTAKDGRPYHHLGAVRPPAGSLPTSSASTRSSSTEPSTDRFIHPCARAPPVPSPTQPYAATNRRTPPLPRARSPNEDWANLTSTKAPPAAHHASIVLPPRHSWGLLYDTTKPCPIPSFFTNSSYAPFMLSCHPSTIQVWSPGDSSYARG